MEEKSEFNDEKAKWNHHFHFYDLFQLNSDRYKKTIIAHLESLRGRKKILDAGAGTGNLTLKLLERKHNVVAIDTNEFGLEILKEKCRKFSEQLKVYNVPMENMNLIQELFDGLVCMFVLPFTKNLELCLKEAYGILKKGGKFTISSWAPVEDSWQGTMIDLEKELRRKNCLPKYQEEFDLVKKSSEANVKVVLQGPTDKEITRLLASIGFSGIKQINSPYGKYAFYIDCVKP